MDVFFKLDNDNWFYFGYTRSVMQVMSTHRPFVDFVRLIPNKNRQMDVKSGEVPYIYMIASDEKWITFRRQYQQRLRKLNMSDANLPNAPQNFAPAESPQDMPEPTRGRKVKEEEAPEYNIPVSKSPGSKTSVEKTKRSKRNKEEVPPPIFQPKEEKVEPPPVEENKPVEEEVKPVEEENPPVENQPEPEDEQEKVQEVQ